MALNQTNKLVWVVETIRKTGKISFEELNRKWMDNEDLSGGEELISQEEVVRNDEYSIFKLRVRPTYDFIQELLWNREELEVLEPFWLRKEVKEVIGKMLKNYPGKPSGKIKKLRD